MKVITLMGLVLILSTCGSQRVSNPSEVLQETGRSPRVQLKAMDQLQSEVGLSSESFQELLMPLLWKPGYTNEVRMAALERLWSVDQQGVIRTLRQQLPRLNNWTWLVEVCDWIAGHNIVELQEGLISSWASPTMMVQTEHERPEYLALVEMVGKDEVVNLVFNTLVHSSQSWKQSYRSRCLELLHRVGERDRIVALLQNANVAEDDVYLQDLRKSFVELGIAPYTREEVIWIRKLASPEYQSFWDEARVALSQLSDARRHSLELRDVPVAVSVHRHAPEYLTMETDAILNTIANQLKGARHYYETEGGGTFNERSEQFRTHRSRLTWGDAMAIQMMNKALQVPQVRKHLLEYGVRDVNDKTTEYGGIIALDKKGRFEILEFEPKIRHHDRRFNASQQMFDAGYTALFHFHYHAQKYRNGDHAGPGLGDKNYADSTRANCVVITFVNEDEVNVDYYRHGGIVVDLGTFNLRQ
ncbi:MAG: hypothetical protein CMJ38_02680 [Phycisphaerae bacterium]|nr:hypothetical protein [Phycisphaerae bacterium]